MYMRAQLELSTDWEVFLLMQQPVASALGTVVSGASACATVSMRISVSSCGKRSKMLKGQTRHQDEPRERAQSHYLFCDIKGRKQ